MMSRITASESVVTVALCVFIYLPRWKSITVSNNHQTGLVFKDLYVPALRSSRSLPGRDQEDDQHEAEMDALSSIG
ncbi:hypothetical protein SCHPADRAFT_899822 [Schizopora paradoxa]|uniref:Uncharacterized protein n=1 Tax=Schizopora paradoxa TaxID=27342 RepID=A0A0H2S373_9AGAM|nr:hypothetical protein SCHPADRAFT_899822 [Schizopora paradoxa]